MAVGTVASAISKEKFLGGLKGFHETIAPRIDTLLGIELRNSISPLANALETIEKNGTDAEKERLAEKLNFVEGKIEWINKNLDAPSIIRSNVQAIINSLNTICKEASEIGKRVPTEEHAGIQAEIAKKAPTEEHEGIHAEVAKLPLGSEETQGAIKPDVLADMIRDQSGIGEKLFDSFFGEKGAKLVTELAALSSESLAAVGKVLFEGEGRYVFKKDLVAARSERLEMAKVIRTVIKELKEAFDKVDEEPLRLALDYVWQESKGGDWMPMGTCWTNESKIFHAIKDGRASREPDGKVVIRKG